MKKNKFSYKYTDKNDGEKITAKVKLYVTDLTKDLGSKFVFIEATYHESQRTVKEEVSVPLRAVKKLIKALQKVSK